MGFVQGRAGRRIVRRYRPGRNDNNSFQNMRKGSGDARGGPVRDFRRNRNDRKGSYKTKMIGKRRRFNEKPHKKGKIEKDDLDRQMRQYWIKSGSHKGTEEAKKDQNLAVQKMNEEMDDYWKNASKKKNNEDAQNN